MINLRFRPIYLAPNVRLYAHVSQRYVHDKCNDIMKTLHFQYTVYMYTVRPLMLFLSLFGMYNVTCIFFNKI